MLSVGAVEQSNMTSGYSRFNATNSGRLLETNTENLLRMVLYLFKHFEILHYTHTHTQQYKLLNIHLELAQVSYCENDVDCRRLIQLVHFGEKFDSSNCHKTCDNCVKVTSFVEKDVTEIAKQLVWNQILSIYCSHSSTS